ncbi:thiamine phosphate synthase [Alcaligenaceae bacterium A4P071]|nr:thiamine phosphate synthase [Alcaligenaceae bacterium A4P071]
MTEQLLPSDRATPLRFPAGLYGVTPGWEDTDRLVAAVRAAAAGGMRSLQYRSKHPDRALRMAQAQALRAVCTELDVVYLVNDEWAIALAVGADGVHLGRDDGDIEAARTALGPEAIVGVSCYDDLDRARALLVAGADYIAFGAVYSSTVKPGAPRATLDLLRQARSLVAHLPALRPAVVAIGGITPDNAAPVAAAGADALAVITGLFDAPDITAAARRLAAACA